MSPRGRVVTGDSDAVGVIAVAAPWSLRSLFFAGALWDRLASLGHLRIPPDGADLRDVDTYARLLADADVVVTTWGCPPLSHEVLAAAPRLRLLAHTGASVKGYATGASFAARGAGDAGR